MDCLAVGAHRVTNLGPECRGQRTKGSGEGEKFLGGRWCAFSLVSSVFGSVAEKGVPFLGSHCSFPCFCNSLCRLDFLFRVICPDFFFSSFALS